MNVRLRPRHAWRQRDRLHANRADAGPCTANCQSPGPGPDWWPRRCATSAGHTRRPVPGRGGRGGLGGPGRDDPANAGVDYSPKPPVKLLPPAEELKHFQLQTGYRVELVLAEPDIAEPAAITFDGNGRMYVTELRSYMNDADGTDTLDADRPHLATRRRRQ